MLLQQLFSFLCSRFILCNPFFPLPFPAPASFPCPLVVTHTHIQTQTHTHTHTSRTHHTHTCLICLFIFPSLQSLFLPPPPSLAVFLPSLTKSYQAVCQIIRQDICLKTHLQTGIILSHRRNFNQTWQQNVSRSWQIDTKRKTDRKRENYREGEQLNLELV